MKKPGMKNRAKRRRKVKGKMKEEKWEGKGTEEGGGKKRKIYSTRKEKMKIKGEDT
jgi:hypothetical protein